MATRDARRLKQQLEVAQAELKDIKSSRAFKTVRAISHVKNQVKASPFGVAKKVTSKLLSGTLLAKGRAVNKNLSSATDIQSQYNQWIVLNEPDATELDSQRVESDRFGRKPLISIVTPIYNPPLGVFEELIQSVQAQTYPNFELCLLDDFGQNADVIELIGRYAATDSRIKYIPFDKNRGIAGASNKILETVEGEFIALLDHDDTLSPNALFENVKLLNKDDYDFIYSDKDKIDESGHRFDPFFKPGWSPELMLSANYLTHLNVMKTSVVKRVGGWDESTNGAQDWDLFLKVVAASKKIGHVQKVLYHWRVIATSTAMSIETKPYALEGQRRAVDKYLKKMKIPATSYHEGAELLLDWQDAKKKTVVIVNAHSNSHLGHLLNTLSESEAARDSEVFVMHAFELSQTIVNRKSKVSFVEYKPGSYAASVRKIVRDHKDGYVLFFDDRLNFTLDAKQLRRLTGWLDIDGVMACAPRVVNRDNFSVDSGAMITSDGIKPLFAGSPPYHQTPLGNIEWVRDLTLVSSLTFTVRAAGLSQILDSVESSKLDDDEVGVAIQLGIARLGGRAVFNPKVYVSCSEGVSKIAADLYEKSNTDKLHSSATDPYTNVNLSDDDPMRIAEIVKSNEMDEFQMEVEYSYHVEAMAHAAARSLSDANMAKNSEIIKNEHSKELQKIESALFLLPDFYAIYAGLNNIFSYADYLREKGVKVTIGLMTADTSFDRQRQLITDKFPQLGDQAAIIAVSNSNVSSLPHFDIAVCTQWATAYLLALFNKTHRKCYFIQDKEASFYPKGTISALVDNTYRLGFIGLANTPGLLEWYAKEYGGTGIVVKSKVDLSKYQPPKQAKLKLKQPYKVFFYARPNEPRNAFELGVASLLKLKERMGDRIEMYAAGAEWNPTDYGLDGVVDNLGKISYEKLPAFYRSMDAGIMFMFSGHPGVVASELMASGCPVVVNRYDDPTWNDLYRHEETCLVSFPTADEVARNVLRSLEDSVLRKKVIEGALGKVKEFYADYDASLNSSYEYLKTGK